MDSIYKESFTGEPQAYHLFITGYHLQMKGDLEASVRLYQQSLESYPTAQAYTFLGWAYSNMGRHLEAIKECENAIFMDPEFGNPYNDIGCYLLHLGKPDDAISWFKKSLLAKKYESYYFPHLNLGRVYADRGEFENALKHFRLAIKENPLDVQARLLIRHIQDYPHKMEPPDNNTPRE